MSRCRITYLTGLLLSASLAAGGCGRQENKEAAVPAPERSVPATTIPDAALAGNEATPGDSGLAIKRAVVTGEGDHATLRACDEKAYLWLIDGEGALTELLTADASSMYIEAYGERAAVPQNLPAARSLAGAFVLEQLLYAGVPGEGRGCSGPQPDYAVMARGNEPFWSASVMENRMIWRQPEAEITLHQLQSEDAEGTVSYRATAENHALELFVGAQPCRDSMSGEYFALSARAVLDGREFKGCARVGKQDAP